ncbi:MAG TPA: zinc-finger domain-containing protein [Burkholderiales bacterium]|nr:zinc-finger domain-containing protein [Burkholderiales bacterium]
MESAARNGRGPRQVEITAAELPLHCPLPSQALWNSHPRVFLPIGDDGQALCPYCGTRYVLRGGVKASH